MRKATTAAKIEHKRTPCLRRCNSATFLSTVGSLKYGWMKELLPKFGLQLEKDLTFVPVGSTSTGHSPL